MATTQLHMGDAPDGARHYVDPGTDGPALSALAVADDGGYRLTLQVGGLKCARCIAAVENSLKDDPRVDFARVNFSTSRLSVHWQGARDVGDALVAGIRALGYSLSPASGDVSADASREQRQLLKAVATAGFAMGNMMLLSIMLWSSDDVAMGPATRTLFHWVMAAIALPIVIYAGQVFFRSAFGALKGGRTNMDVPISLALILASAMSVAETIAGGAHVYFDGAVMLLFFLLIGRYLDARARGQARASAVNLMQHFSGVAERVDAQGHSHSVPIRDLVAGDVIRLVAGSTVPSDAAVTSGIFDMDNSLVTGESLSVSAQPGDGLYAGTMVLGGSGTATITKPSDDSLLADIIRLMEVAEQGHGQYVRLADRAAALYTPLVHSLALLTFLGWWLIGGLAWQPSLVIAISVLIITCPCALGLAVPVVQVLTSGWLFKRGILVKSGDALERLATVTQVMFDKTGTLTLGRPVLIDGDWTDADLARAAAVAVHSRHPLSKALVAAAKARDLELQNIDGDIREVAGAGLEVQTSAGMLRLGRAAFANAGITPAVDGLADLWLKAGDDDPVRFAFDDVLRVDAADTVAALQARGLTASLISGDRRDVATRIGAAAGITHIAAELTPPEKVKMITDMEDAGHAALMVGDGLNDAAALSAASVSMAPSTALDISQQAADMVFQGDRLAAVANAHAAATMSTRLVKQNFVLAVAYNIVAIPLAVAGHVTPLLAAIAMSGSSLLVIANAFRLGPLMKSRILKETDHG